MAPEPVEEAVVVEAADEGEVVEGVLLDGLKPEDEEAVPEAEMVAEVSAAAEDDEDLPEADMVDEDLFPDRPIVRDVTDEDDFVPTELDRLQLPDPKELRDILSEMDGKD
jgi:hypothetical protein